MDEFKYGELVCIRWFFRKRADSIYKYRCGPVPGIHKYGHGGWYRRPTTKQCLSSNYIADETDKMLLTAHQLNNLGKYRVLPPNAWDDYPRSRKGDSWKNYRDKQYKCVKLM